MAGIFDLFDKMRKKDPAGPVSALVVGLGNPGPKYQNTRHNIGFACIDRIAAQTGIAVNRQKFHALVGEGSFAGQHCLLMKPLTYMNESGTAVEEARAFYKLDISRVIVISDDISLQPGRLRVRKKGSAGGHNGLKSIIYSTGEEDFPRVRVGVGKKPHPDFDLARWVLSQFSADEQPHIERALEDAAAACALIVQGDADRAMNEYNGKVD